MDVSKMTEEDAKKVIEFLGRNRCMSKICFVRSGNVYIVALTLDLASSVKTFSDTEPSDTERLLRYSISNFMFIALNHPSYIELLDKCLSIAEKHDVWIWSYSYSKTGDEKTIFMQKGTILEQLLIDMDMSKTKS